MDARIVRAYRPDTLVTLPVRTGRHVFGFKVAGGVTGIEIDPGCYILKQVQSHTEVRDLPTDDRFVRCDTRIKRRQDLTVAFGSEPERNCRVKLTDANGGRIFTEIAVRRKKEIIVPMEILPPGTYLLYVQNGRQQHVRKIVKPD